MPADAEEILDDAVDQREELDVRDRFETAPLALAVAGRLMRHFDAIVRIRGAAVPDRRDQGTAGGLIARQRVGDQAARDGALCFQELTEESDRSSSIPSGLHEDVDHIPILVNRPPPVLRPALNPHEQLIEIPRISLASPPPSPPSRILQSERQAPSADRLVRDVDAAVGEEVLDVPNTEAEPVSRPGELHPQPLVERYVSLSTHTAPIRRTTCRLTHGCVFILLTLLNLDNDVPDHSTISRRKARLGKVASYERRPVKPVHLLIDSSGLSVHVGQLRTPPKARDYRKLHLAVDEQTSDVVACELTSKRARDASRVASLVGQIERPIASAKADAAYDTGDVYKALENHRAHRSPKVLIPPRKGAQLALDSAGTRQRNRNIRARSRVGKRKWYVASGYSRRSKVETTFHRYKALLGSAMRARGLASQRVEVRLGCKILNTMTALGIPDGEMIG